MSGDADQRASSVCRTGLAVKRLFCGSRGSTSTDTAARGRFSRRALHSAKVFSTADQWESHVIRSTGCRSKQKASVAESLADQIKRHTGEETITSDLTYDLRSGDPDFIDKLVAFTFGTMALDAILEGKSGLMSALVNGRYCMVPIPDPKLGPRRVDVAKMYNTERLRPNYAHKNGLPIFLIELE